tara:strand:+ start:1081 stop:1623 length:543 start_codon:yes stop_codon:yes gene_type:complete
MKAENGFVKINIAIITISDTRDLNNDKSGDVLVERVKKFGHKITAREIVKDDFIKISDLFLKLTKNDSIDVIISTGGTGLTGRDITPEVMKTLFEKTIDGFGEMFRWLSYKKIGTSALQSRALAGVANGKYIFCLPGSPSACKDGWDEILKYQLDIRHKPCNFVEIMPRLQEHKFFRSKN